MGLDLGTCIVLHPGPALCARSYRIGNYVQKTWYQQRRYRTLHQLAILTLGN